jgi:hypothetical protein
MRRAAPGAMKGRTSASTATAARIQNSSGGCGGRRSRSVSPAASLETLVAAAVTATAFIVAAAPRAGRASACTPEPPFSNATGEDKPANHHNCKEKGQASTTLRRPDAVRYQGIHSLAVAMRRSRMRVR